MDGDLHIPRFLKRFPLSCLPRSPTSFGLVVSIACPLMSDVALTTNFKCGLAPSRFRNVD